MHIQKAGASLRAAYFFCKRIKLSFWGSMDEIGNLELRLNNEY